MTHPQSELPRQSVPELPDPLASTAARRLVEPLARFLEIESASGILLVVCTLTALAMANSPLSHRWELFWHTEISLRVGEWELSNSLVHWINDGLMTIFFFVVGLEIKRETVDGELSSVKNAALPIIAALGGMLVPAGVYLLFQLGREGERGWGIPMATDIAFAVGILALLGRRVSAGLKIFLLALAIADDIGAIVIIAAFYSGNIQVVSLGFAALGLGVVVGMNRLGVRGIIGYALVGLGIWLAMYRSGIHPTVAGVVLGIMTPARVWIPRTSLMTFLHDTIDRLDGHIDRPQLAGKLAETARETLSPLERLESLLHGWVAFAIMPIFALANAGVILRLEAAAHPVAWAVAAGLVLGKPIGIIGFSWIAIRCGAAKLPTGASWKALIGAGCLAGIGFTMSLFIAALGLDGSLLDSAKIGTLAGSATSAVLGYGLLFAFLPISKPEASSRSESA